MKEITTISKGKKHVCLVDDEDYDWEMVCEYFAVIK